MLQKFVRIIIVSAFFLALMPLGQNSAFAADGSVKTYVVAFNQPSGLPADVDSMVANAGGNITVKIPEVGGIAVESSDPNFASNMAKNNQVKAVDLDLEASIGPLDNGIEILSAENNGGNASSAGPDPQPGTEPLYHKQWDMMRINASDSGSYAVQRGRRDVVVAVLDTGTDVDHPDIAPNLDVARSRSFVPSEPTVQDFNGHGTHTMSNVGSPINGFGISGVAPNVTLVALKVLGASGSGSFIGVIQAIVYAGQNHFDVASMSLGATVPKCGAVNPNSPNVCDHAAYILTHRAMQFARSNGVLPVASAGNSAWNLSDGNFFRSWLVIPAEIAGVVTVSATGYYNWKSYYSNYGTPIDVSAPGGDRRYQKTPPQYEPAGGRVLGAWSSTALTSLPVQQEEECVGPTGTPPCYYYAYIQGTSMAAPHVSGVAALIISQYGDFTPNNQNNPHMSPTTVESILQITANNQPCPDPKDFVYPFNADPPGTFSATHTCQGDTGNNTFFGKGIVDALKAVTP